MRPADIEGVIALQPLCFPPPFPQDSFWDRDDLETHLQKFPEGQFVAELTGQIVGSASSVIISEQVWQTRPDWYQTVGDTSMDNHTYSGTTLFGADISVSPHHRRQGIGRMLYQARFDLVTQLGLRRFATVCRIPGLVAFPNFTPEQYGQMVASGEIEDRTMTPLIKMGMSYLGIAPEFIDDEESLDCGGVLEWVNDGVAL